MGMVVLQWARGANVACIERLLKRRGLVPSKIAASCCNTGCGASSPVGGTGGATGVVVVVVDDATTAGEGGVMIAVIMSSTCSAAVVMRYCTKEYPSDPPVPSCWKDKSVAMP